MAKSLHTTGNPARWQPPEGTHLEVCMDPGCVCYGMTYHLPDGSVLHRSFTALELIAIAKDMAGQS